MPKVAKGKKVKFVPGAQQKSNDKKSDDNG